MGKILEAQLSETAFAYLMELVIADGQRIRRETEHAKSHGERNFTHSTGPANAELRSALQYASDRAAVAKDNEPVPGQN